MPFFASRFCPLPSDSIRFFSHKHFTHTKPFRGADGFCELYLTLTVVQKHQMPPQIIDLIVF